MIGLLIWWATAGDDEEELIVETEMAEVITTPQVVGTAPGISIGDILGDLGRDDFRAEVTVPADAEMTDRGFWIEDEGERLYVILNDGPMEEPVHINPGQTLRIDQGMLRDRTFFPDLPGQLDATTENIAEQQPIFLVVDEDNIEILEAGMPQPGTHRAPSAPPVEGSM
ncbi:hypothetical protein A9995_13970 [Erythrobacter sp. QSSC1-22B]|nr:hypothetical protein A9995_13970 [Erythrobacter sp. QSSC1-22B]